MSEGAALGSSTIIALSPEAMEALGLTDDELSVYSSALATGGRGVGWSLELPRAWSALVSGGKAALADSASDEPSSRAAFASAVSSWS